MMAENNLGILSGSQKFDSPEDYPHLPAIDIDHVKKPLKIGIVTPEIMGLSHGGIGTAYHALAESLASDGNLVTLLFVPFENPQKNLFQKCLLNYSEKNIHVELFPLEEQESFISIWKNAKRSYGVMHWLLEMSHFDILHFPDWKGLGYYTALAKHQGLAFLETAIVVGTHSSTFWDATYSYGDKAYYQDFMERNFIERESVRLSDFVVSPSQYYLGWLKNEQHWQLPERSYVQPNIMKSNLTSQLPNDHPSSPKTNIARELVFFGRLEKRKGLVLLCDALDHPNICNRDDFSVSFMGHSTYVEGKTAYEYLKERSSRWRFSWKVIPRKTRDEALAYLRESGRFALIPSLSETMSYTVLECLWAEIPFLAARVGGIPELITPSDLERVTFEPLPHKLAAALEKVIGHDVLPSTPAFDLKENEKRWIDWHQQIFPTPKEFSQDSLPDPIISVCLIIDGRETIPQKLVSSLNSQDYSNTEVIVVCKGVTGQRTPQEKDALEDQGDGWRSFTLEGLDISTARNLAARNASGEYLLFLDLDVQLDRGAISSLISVAKKVDADILTFAKMDSNIELNHLKKAVQFYLGNCLSLGALHNVFGDANMFVKNSVFKNLSGFSENNYMGDSIWEFFAKASVSGCKMETISLPLIQKENIPRQGIQSPRFVHHHPYLNEIAPPFHDLFNFLQASRFFHDPAPDGSFTEGFVNRPQGFVDEYWNSRPWRLLLPLLNYTRKHLGLPCYLHPRVTTLTEALNAVQTIHQSILWNIIVQLQKIRRSLKGFRS
jgi:glycosyltransferase involved in cell wall biosynthesis